MDTRWRGAWILAPAMVAELLVTAVAAAKAPPGSHDPLAKAERRLSRPVQATVHAVTAPHGAATAPREATAGRGWSPGVPPPAAQHSRTTVDLHVDTSKRSGSFWGMHGLCRFSYTVYSHSDPGPAHPTHAGPITGECAGEGGLRGGWILQRDGTIQVSVKTQAGHEYHIHF